MLREILALVDVLDARIINYNINSPKFGQCLIHEIFAVYGFGEISINIECLYFGILIFEILLDFIDFDLVG